jgi:RNA polymerase sigma factor (sigma-70 family)
MSNDNLEMADLRLLRRVVDAQDRDALKALHAKYYANTKHFIASRIGSLADSEDIAQDVFVQIWKLGDGLDIQRTVEAYILGIARRLIGEYFRNVKRAARTVPLGSVGEIADNHSQRASGARLEDFWRLELNEAIRDAAAKLPHKYREAIA